MLRLRLLRPSAGRSTCCVREPNGPTSAPSSASSRSVVTVRRKPISRRPRSASAVASGVPVAAPLTSSLGAISSSSLPPMTRHFLMSEFTDACKTDRELVELIKAADITTSLQHGATHSKGLGHGGAATVARSLSIPDLAVMPFVVESILQTSDLNPGAIHEMLALMSRFHGAIEESNGGSSGLLKQLLHAVEHTHPTDATPSEIARMKQVHLVAKFMLSRDGGGTSHLSGSGGSNISSDLESFQELLPIEIIQSLLSTSESRVCSSIVDHIAVCLGVDGEGTRASVEGDWLFTVAGALLSNDAFFAASQFKDMHSALLKLIQCTRLVNPQDRGVVPVFNKASRVYAKQAAGTALREIDMAFFSQYPSAVKLMPWQYYVRCLGALFDEEKAAGQTEEALRAFSHTSCLRYWNTCVGPLTQSFLKLHSQTLQAVETYWKMLFKSAMLLPGEELAFYRASRAYLWFAGAGVPVAMTKDGLAQITRLICEAIRTPDLNGSNALGTPEQKHSSIPLEKEALISDLPDGWLGDSLAEFLAVLTKTPCATFHWGLNVMDTLYKALLDSTTLSKPHKKAAAHQIYVWITQEFFPTKKVTGTDPFNVSSIRRFAEMLEIVEPSVFWWKCGCGSSNPSSSDTCSQCMRGNHTRWVCTHPKCKTPHVDPGLVSCSKCRLPHPLLQEATALNIQLCSTCVFSPLDPTTRQCQRCVAKAKDTERANQKSGNCTNKKVGSPTSFDKYAFMCPQCKMHHNSQVHCPSCGLKTNPDEDLSMWHCSTCHNYNFSFNKTCSRCYPKKTPRSTSALRVKYSTWDCGCGATNPMVRLSCHSCDKRQAAQGSSHMPKGFTCAACSKYSSPNNWSSISVTPEHGAPTKMDVCSCTSCGEYHPREVAVLNSAGLTHPCFSCGSSIVVGSEECPKCHATQAGFSSLLPFWCESCDMKSIGQIGFECAGCRTVRPELRHAAYLWKCERASPSGGPCEGWNPSWSSSCSKCTQTRVYDPKYEIRARHTGRWTCSSCSSVNEPEEMLMCPHCDEGLQDAEECSECRERHFAYHCPNDEAFAVAAKMVSELNLDSASLLQDRGVSVLKGK